MKQLIINKSYDKGDIDGALAAIALVEVAVQMFLKLFQMNLKAKQ